MDQEAQAHVDAWKYAHGFTEMTVVRCVIELGVADVLESHGSPMSISELSSAVGCPEASLYRIMRFMTHRGIFQKQTISPIGGDDDPPSSSVCYAQTPLSRLLMRDNMGIYVLAQSVPDLGLSVKDLKAGKGSGSGSEAASTEDELWSLQVYEKQHALFQDFFAWHAKAVASAVISNCPETFRGIASLVDVGGHKGTALGMLVQAFPWIRGINFDLPNVVSGAPVLDGVEHVGGDMFKSSIPKADAAMLMWILHDWSDEACIEILKKCKEAVAGDTGKVIIVDTVLDGDDEGERDEYAGARVALDMTIMIACANGKERTAKEWARLIDAAGFSRHTIKHMKAIESVIEAYP